MSAWTGALAGALAGGGCLFLVTAARARRPGLSDRVVPYLAVSAPSVRGTAHGADDLPALVRTSARGLADRLDRLLGGSASIATRLGRAGDTRGVAQFRLEQLTWAAAGFTATFVLMLVLLAGGGGVGVPAALLMCGCAAVGGLLGRDQALSRAAARRTARVEAEFPTVAELLALAVAAGEGAVGAVARVARVCSGELAGELRRVQGDARTGTGFAEALDAMARRLDVDSVSRFVHGMVVAAERGTPLADVLHAQAADAREVRRRQLMESAGRREVAMLVPVVFLILPVTVVFALFPGFYGLNLTVQ